jgi:hypothetical protein
VLAGLVLVAAVLAAVIFGVYESLPHHNLPDNYDFHGEKITDARKGGVHQLEAQLKAVEGRSGTEHIGPTGRTDRCVAGQDNFEISDAYAYSCTIELVQLFPVREPVKAEASRLAEALIAGDCPKGTTTDFTLAEYHRRLEDLPESGGDCVPGYASVPPRITGWIRVDSTHEELRDAAFHLPTTCRLSSSWDFCEDKRLDLVTAVSAAPRGTPYVAVVVVRRDYYDVDW